MTGLTLKKLFKCVVEAMFGVGHEAIRTTGMSQSQHGM